MKQISNKEYEEWVKYKEEQRKGHILLPDTIRFICEAYHFDAFQIGKHFLDLMPNIPNIEKRDLHYYHIIKEYLFANAKLSDRSQIIEAEKRKNGKEYFIKEHIKGMVYSLLSNQTPWIRIEPHLPEIDNLFGGYDPSFITEKDPSFFSQGLKELRCGNRNVDAQMKALPHNIKIFKQIEKDYGSIDNFLNSDSSLAIVNKLSSSNSEYKMKQMGEALVWEYLKNVGVNCAKPDTHLLRFFGANRMGTGNHSPATIKELYSQIQEVADATGEKIIEVDYVIWNFCAEGYGEVCTKEPKCSICPIRGECNYTRKG